jgi:uncharacterized protein YqjF (DUF2071 family)
MRWLPIHPVAMRTTFSVCVLVNYAVDPAALTRLLPSHLKPETHEGRGFVSIVIAKMDKMRPAFLPRSAGITYHQVVYRAVVRCGTERGVAFLRSDADNCIMVAAGNALTFFRFHRAEISCVAHHDTVSFSLRPSGNEAAVIDARYQISDALDELPPSTHFPDLRTAQTFLSELYVAFGARRADGRIEVVRIERTPWHSRVVPDGGGRYEAMTSGVLFKDAEATLDSIFLVRNLSYRWERLSLERPADA